MPIEFRCPSCSRLLRTPDESAGKKAKCPQCGFISDVPWESAGAGATEAPPPGQPPGQSRPASPAGPFAAVPPSSTPRDFPLGGGVNPYASPALDDSASVVPLAPGNLVPTRISFDRIFATVWQVFKQQMGPMALFGLVLLLINVGLQVIGQGGGAAVRATGDPVVIAVFTVLNTLFGMLVQTWVNIGSALYMLKAARSLNPTLNELGNAGPYFLRVILLQLVIGLTTFGILAACLAPALIAYLVTGQQEVGVGVFFVGLLIAVLPVMYVVYRWFVAMFFIVDRNLGVMDSLSHSAHFMASNKLTAFLVMLVVGFVGTLLGLFTCCVGFVLVIPYLSLMMAAIYLSATGQPWGTGPATGQ